MENQFQHRCPNVPDGCKLIVWYVVDYKTRNCDRYWQNAYAQFGNMSFIAITKKGQIARPLYDEKNGWKVYSDSKSWFFNDADLGLKPDVLRRWKENGEHNFVQAVEYVRDNYRKIMRKNGSAPVEVFLDCDS
jgi:hypothetical protein